MSEALALIALATLLAVAVHRPYGWPEAVIGVPIALILVATPALSWHSAWEEVHRLLPVVGFLAAVLAIAALCDVEGLFDALGERLSHRASSGPVGFLRGVVAVAAVVTIVLSLDATVVLLTPVVVAATRQRRFATRAPVLACGHLANSASLLLPVSNLTNLLAFSVSGLSFLRFAGLMLLPQLCVLLIEYVGIRLLFRNDLGEVSRTSADGATRPLPRVPLVVIGATLAGFVVCSAVGIDPAWAAGAGAATLGMRALWQRRVGPAYIVRAAHPGFLLFVLALAAVVRAVQDHGLRDVVDGAVPNGSTLLALLGVAALAAVLANVLNNLPATLLLLPVVATAGVGPLLAMLIGVNVGPNLTYTGSLATLLWRRALPTDVVPGTGDYVRLGLLTVPAGLVVGVVALWVGLRVF